MRDVVVIGDHSFIGRYHGRPLYQRNQSMKRLVPTFLCLVPDGTFRSYHFLRGKIDVPSISALTFQRNDIVDSASRMPLNLVELPLSKIHTPVLRSYARHVILLKDAWL